MQIQVDVTQRRSGMLCATSPDMRGLIVAAQTLAELAAMLPASIGAHFEFRGESVSVRKTGDSIHFWTIEPVGECEVNGCQNLPSIRSVKDSG